MECKFYNQDKTLVRSHIIPKSFYELESFGNIVPKITGSSGFMPKRSPNGIWDSELFCSECEKKFDKYDDYAFKLLYENANLRKQKMHRGSVFGEYYDSYDYVKLKLFFMSVLFRAGLSDFWFFQHVTLGPHYNSLNNAIKKGDPLSPSEFAVYVAFYSEVKDGKGPLMFMPNAQRLDNVKFYHFHIGRYFFYIKVDKQKVPYVYEPFILKPDKKLYLICYKFSDQGHDIIDMALKNPANKKYYSS